MQSREIAVNTSGPSIEALPDASGFQLFDAHCHLQDDRLSGREVEILERAQQKRVTAMMCCGCQENDWERVYDLSRRDGVWVSFGLHPWFVRERTTDWLKRLRGFLESVPHAGVGEIGLDRAVQSDLTLQEDVFVQQLRLARDLKRPVSIHCRRAFGRMIELLEKEGGVQSGLIHSYSGSVDLLPVFERLGLYVSFSGTITHTNSKRARQAIAAVSKDRLLIETDSPDLPPEGTTAGMVNEPANLPFVLEAAARLIGLSAQETAKLTFDNARRLFGLRNG